MPPAILQPNTSILDRLLHGVSQGRQVQIGFLETILIRHQTLSISTFHTFCKRKRFNFSSNDHRRIIRFPYDVERVGVTLSLLLTNCMIPPLTWRNVAILLPGLSKTLDTFNSYLFGMITCLCPCYRDILSQHWDKDESCPPEAEAICHFIVMPSNV